MTPAKVPSPVTSDGTFPSPVAIARLASDASPRSIVNELFGVTVHQCVRCDGCGRTFRQSQTSDGLVLSMPDTAPDMTPVTAPYLFRWMYHAFSKGDSLKRCAA